MILILVFVSGFASLIYQVLWMKQLGLLFGNTSQAAAVTLAAFFGGLAAGSWLWGRRCTRLSNPLRTYARLEAGIAITAAGYFVILLAFHALYPPLYQAMGSGLAMLGVKFLLALLLVFPPALFMGGTIPVIGQSLIGGAGQDVKPKRPFGTTAALVYGVNTIGAAFGALMAGFYLPLWFGFRATCAVAMMLTSLAAVGAFLLSRPEASRAATIGTTVSTRQVPPTVPEVAAPQPGLFEHLLGLLPRLPLAVICFLSGFGFLALEVLWTRMFLQVLENSVYTFAAILVISLVCLAAGAGISSLLARLKVAPTRMLAWLMLLSGITIAATPFLFMHATNSLQVLAMRDTWSNYVLMIFQKGFLTIGPSALVLGTVFPFLMKTEERYVRVAGRSLGRLAAVNTAGAILGSLLCGFVLLGTLGMWGTMRFLAACYILAGLIVPLAWSLTEIKRCLANGVVPALRLLGKLVADVYVRYAGLAMLGLLFTWLNPTALPIVSTDPMRQQRETILETWEASDGTVAVTRGPYGLTIRLNSDYSLGNTGAFMQERLQNDLPMMVYPDTRSIFFLGMGTGITAGGALDERFEHIERIVVCELSPKVITAAKKYITNVEGEDLTGGLFKDPRVTILPEDGRHYLMATRQRFDMINGDLFVPFRTGVGNLYTREHFRNVRDRLEPGGVFFQWIPLYQVTEYEFKVIARTMLDVFDQVSLWRLGFQPGYGIVALAGHRDNAPLPATDIDSRADMRAAVAGASAMDTWRLALPFNPQTIPFFYCGNVSKSASLFQAYPVNTDNHPVVEYMAPRSYRQNPKEPSWFVGPRLAELVDQMLTLCPPSGDPLLANRSDADRRLPLAGHHFYQTRLWQMLGDPARSEQAWRNFLENWGP